MSELIEQLYQGRCRDCADLMDADGICPNHELPCKSRVTEKVIQKIQKTHTLILNEDYEEMQRRLGKAGKWGI